MKNKKGFTLIELIVAMSVAAIFMISVVALISPSTKIFNRTEDSSDARLLAESLLEEIRHQANLSTELKAGEIDRAGNGSVLIDQNTISIDEEGYIIETKAGKSKKLFDDKFYKNKTIGMTAVDVKDTPNCVDMTLKIYSEGRELYSVDSRLKPVLDKGKTVVSGGSEDPEEPGGSTGGVVITTGKGWTLGEYYRRGDIFEHNGQLYIVILDLGQLHEGWYPLGPDAFPALCATVKDKILTDDDLVNIGGELCFENVYPGDQYLNTEGVLYIYMNASGGAYARLPSSYVNDWHRYN